jgi:hypothetical protein
MWGKRDDMIVRDEEPFNAEPPPAARRRGSQPRRGGGHWAGPVPRVTVAE